MAAVDIKRSNWRHLLGLALPALDHVFGETPPADAPKWTFGGGTALALSLNHRVSYDIDIFVSGTLLKMFTPAENPAARAISENFQWPGHYLKFELADGEIDFLSPGLLTEPGYWWANIEGRRIAVETPEEIIVKKIRYRSERFTERDVFDLAALYWRAADLPAVLAREVPDLLPRLEDTIGFLARNVGVAGVTEAVAPTDAGWHIIPQTFTLALGAIEEARIITKKPTSSDGCPKPAEMK